MACPVVLSIMSDRGCRITTLFAKPAATLTQGDERRCENANPGNGKGEYGEHCDNRQAQTGHGKSQADQDSAGDRGREFGEKGFHSVHLRVHLRSDETELAIQE